MDPPLARAETVVNIAMITAAMIASLVRNPRRSAFIFLLGKISFDSPTSQ